MRFSLIACAIFSATTGIADAGWHRHLCYVGGQPQFFTQSVPLMVNQSVPFAVNQGAFIASGQALPQTASAQGFFAPSDVVDLIKLFLEAGKSFRPDNNTPSPNPGPSTDRIASLEQRVGTLEDGMVRINQKLESLLANNPTLNRPTAADDDIPRFRNGTAVGASGFVIDKSNNSGSSGQIRNEDLIALLKEIRMHETNLSNRLSNIEQRLVLSPIAIPVVPPASQEAMNDASKKDSPQTKPGDGDKK